MVFILTSIASLIFGVYSNVVLIVSLLYMPEFLTYSKKSSISFLDTLTLSATITAPFSRHFFSADLRYFKYSILAASKNISWNVWLSFGMLSKALPSITSILSVGLGAKIPIFIAPAMHEAMYYNQLVIENILKLKKLGVIFLDPEIIEGKAKILQPDKALKSVLEFFTKSTKKILSGKNILVTSGGTMEYIDPVRVITNLSSGKMGNAIIKESLELGAHVTHIVGNSSVMCTSESSYLETIKVGTSDEMYTAVISEIRSKKYDLVVFAAAVTDFKLLHIHKKKIPSQISHPINLELVPTKKIIDEIKLIDKNIFLVGFKAYSDVSNTFLINKAKKKLKECNADIIIANDVGRTKTKIGSDYNEVFIVTQKEPVLHLNVQSKDSIAKKLFEIIISKLK